MERIYVSKKKGSTAAVPLFAFCDDPLNESLLAEICYDNHSGFVMIYDMY